MGVDFIVLAAFLFMLGASVASFLGVVIDRLPQNKSILKGRSICNSCGKKLSWKELVPIISYMVLGGKCQLCKKSISKSLIISEALSGVSLVLYFFMMLSSGLGFFYILFSTILIYSLIVIFIIDYFQGLL